MAAVGNIEVGNKTPSRNLGRPMNARTDGDLRIEAPNTEWTKRPVNCRAMSQQRGDSGNYSTPQKFVQLVGCRDPKAGGERTVRASPAKS
jgi:hypothetical protein